MRRNFMATRLAVALESVDQQQEEEMIKLKQYGEATLTAGLEQRAIALESYVTALESAKDSPELMQLMGVSTEGFLGKMADSAKEALADMTVSFRKWKVGDWSKLSEEDQIRLVKKAKLQFFHFNPKHLPTLESIYKLNLEAVDVLVNTHDEAKLEVIVKKITTEVKKIIAAAGGNVDGKDLKALQGEFKKCLADYVPSDTAKPDPTAIPKLLEMVEKYKISTKNIDALKLVAKDVGLEATGTIGQMAKASVQLVLGFFFFFSGFFPVGIIFFIFSIANFAQAAADGE